MSGPSGKSGAKPGGRRRAGAGDQAAPVPTLRLDKWLWQARFFRARPDAAEAVTEGKVRLNGTKVRKPGHALRPGDVLTFVQGARVRVVRVTSLGLRRGPASEAADLFFDLDAPVCELAQTPPSLLE